MGNRELTPEEQEQHRYSHEEQENDRASEKIFRDKPFMGIQDEYFDEPSPNLKYLQKLEEILGRDVHKNNQTWCDSVRKVFTEVFGGS